MTDSWHEIAKLAEQSNRPFSDQRSELVEAAELFEANIELLHSSYPADYLDVYGYRLFPPAEEIMGWTRKIKGWPKTWFPLSSSFHLFVFFLDRKTGEVKRVFLDNERDLDGIITGEERVYPDLKTFLEVVLINYRWITKTSFSISVEGFFKEEVATLLPTIVRRIKSEGEGLDGPIILPFFQGTLGEHNHLATIK